MDSGPGGADSGRGNHRGPKSSGNLDNTVTATSPKPYRTSKFDALLTSDASSSHNRSVDLANEVSSSAHASFENLLRISLKSSSKIGIEKLRRKLKRELDQVRRLVKKLEAKELEFSGYSSCGGYTQSQFSANNMAEKLPSAMEVDSEAGSEKAFGEEPESNKYCPNPETAVGKKKLTKDGSQSNEVKGGKTGLQFRMGKGSCPLFKSCSDLLAKMMKHKYGWVFNMPVDAKGLGLHDYHKIIKKPMDLGTVKKRLNQNWYKSASEFAEDVRLTFSNAMLYNPKGQDVHFMAEQLSKIFEQEWTGIEAKCNTKRRSGIAGNAAVPTPTSRKASAPTAPNPGTGKEGTFDRSESMTKLSDPKRDSQSFTQPRGVPVSKKSEAGNTSKRDMTLEEKQRLSTDLQNLPSDKLDDVVQIIKARNQGLSQNDDEIEVDIATLDAETLWELSRFVSNHRNSLSKNKRKAQVSVEVEDDNADSLRGSGSESGSDASR